MLFGVIAILCTALFLGWIAVSFLFFPATTKKYFSDRPELLINKNPIVQTILADASPNLIRIRGLGVYVSILLSLILLASLSGGGILRDAFK